MHDTTCPVGSHILAVGRSTFKASTTPPSGGGGGGRLCPVGQVQSALMTGSRAGSRLSGYYQGIFGSTKLN